MDEGSKGPIIPSSVSDRPATFMIHDSASLGQAEEHRAIGGGLEADRPVSKHRLGEAQTKLIKPYRADSFKFSSELGKRVRCDLSMAMRFSRNTCCSKHV